MRCVHLAKVGKTKTRRPSRRVFENLKSRASAGQFPFRGSFGILSGGSTLTEPSAPPVGAGADPVGAVPCLSFGPHPAAKTINANKKAKVRKTCFMRLLCSAKKGAGEARSGHQYIKRL